jgi:hypothetical protein
MVKGSDGKDYQMSVRRNEQDTSVEITAMKRASDGKDATMMAAKGITVGKGFSQDELAAVYDGFATMKGRDLDAMNGVTLEKGTRKQLMGTDSNETAEYVNQFDRAFSKTFSGVTLEPLTRLAKPSFRQRALYDEAFGQFASPRKREARDCTFDVAINSPYAA